jgi:CRISPR-associated protein Csd1
MMLQALCELAQREHQGQDPLFTKRANDFVCQLSKDGRLLALISTRDERGRSLQILAPRLPEERTGKKVLAVPLADNAKYVLGVESRPGGKRVDQERLDRCADAFATSAEGLRQTLDDDGLNAVVAFLRDREKARAQVFAHHPRKEWTGGEWLAFRIEGDSGFVHERPAVVQCLQHLVQADESGGAPSQCLVSGVIAPVTRLHPLIKRIRGTNSKGAPIVSFNESAFESYGLEQGNNAPVSAQAAREYGAGLNWLLEPHAGRPHRYGIDVGEDVLVFWCRSSHQTSDLVADFFAPNAQQVAAVAASPFTGIPPADIPTDAFFAMFLGGQKARVIVRDWLVTTAGEVHDSLRQYWEDLRLVGGDDRPRPIWSLLASLEGLSGQGLSPSLAGRLVRCALRGGRFPPELLAAALRRMRLPPDEHDRQRMHDRCSLIKAVLNRQLRAAQRKELSVSLDEACRETPYLLGRLFAVMERLQGVALPGVNASIRDKYFGSASTRPALVFPRLLQLSAHHVAKAERAGWLERIKSEIMGGLPAARFPTTLALDDQGLFAVGYYHQRQRLFQKRES